jgi:hypothetical protein
MNLKITEETQQSVQAISFQRQFLNLQLQVSLMSDLITKLDPVHDYEFNAEQGEFVKTKVEAPKGEKDGS